MMPPKGPNELPFCHQRLDCHVKNGVWPECASDAELLHPAFSAEELCPQALARHLRMHSRRDGYTDFCSANDALELGLSLSDDPAIAAEAFDFAEARFLRVQEHARVSPQLAVGSRLCLIFLPAYRARYAEQTLPVRTVEALHKDVVDIIATFDDVYDPRGTDRYSGLQTELVVIALFSRLKNADWLAYPAAPREEHSEVNMRFNHDSYVRLNAIKVPIQAKRKSGRSYDEQVAVVKFKTILDRINKYHTRRLIQLWGNKRKLVTRREPLTYVTFTDLLVREVHGPPLDEHEHALLNMASMTAVAEVIEKYKIITGEQQPDDSPDSSELQVA